MTAGGIFVSGVGDKRVDKAWTHGDKGSDKRTQALVLRALAKDHAQLLAEGCCRRVYATDDRGVRIPYHGGELTTGGRAAVRLAGSVGCQSDSQPPWRASSAKVVTSDAASAECSILQPLSV